jgi:hypothetical protein
MLEADAAIFQIEPTEDFAKRVFSKRSNGGLGLTRHLGMATEKNQLLSRAAYLSFLSEYHPTTDNDRSFLSIIF